MLDLHLFRRCLLAPIAGRPEAVAQCVMRVALAQIFWRSGQTKIASWSTTLMLFSEEYRVPAVPAEAAAYAAAAFELACPILLVAGFLTRLALLPLLAMTIVIQSFVYPLSWPDHIVWFAMICYLLVRGPGILSLDYLLLGRNVKQP
ncbi:MAG: DoxX family membrane protein [Dongiaceae bacterium]